MHRLAFHIRWRSGPHRLVAACLALAAIGLGSCGAALNATPQPDQARFWMRAATYQTAVTVALARSDIERSDPALIARDFTREVEEADEDHHVVNRFTPCPLSASQLLGPDEVNCSLSPGPVGVSDDPKCPWRTCVIISVGSETWADPQARQVILSALADFDKVCAAARTYGPNKPFDAAATGCDRKGWGKVRLAIEVKPRRLRPCAYQNRIRVCSNPDATLVLLD